MSGRRAKWAVGIAAALLLALFVANLALGSFLRDRIGDSIGKRLDGPVEVEIGSRPALLQLADGQLGEVEVRAPDASTCRYSSLDVEARLRDVSLGSPASFSSAAVTIGIGPEAMEELVARRGNGRAAGLLSGVAPNPAAGTVELAAGPGGLIHVALRPTLEGETIGMEVVGATALGQSLPPALLARLRDRLDFSRTLSQLPLGLEPSSVRVGEEGIVVELEAGAGRLAEGKGDRRRMCREVAL